MLLMMGVIILFLFRLCTVQVCSRTRANVSYIGFSLLLLVSSMHISAKGVLVQNIQSHSPFVPQFFLRCWFHLNDSVVWCTLSFSFNWYWLSSQLELLFENFGWQYVCVLSRHTAEGLWTCLWRWQVFCSRLIALVLLLLPFATVRSQGYEMCFKCGSAQQYVSNGVDSTGADAFCMDVAVRQAT
jgi:hypothetical protein